MIWHRRRDSTTLGQAHRSRIGCDRNDSHGGAAKLRKLAISANNIPDDLCDMTHARYDKSESVMTEAIKLMCWPRSIQLQHTTLAFRCPDLPTFGYYSAALVVFQVASFAGEPDRLLESGTTLVAQDMRQYTEPVFA